VASGGRLVLGGPQAELYAGIVDISGGGALWVEEGGLLSINMSSRVSVNGENPDRTDYSDDYIALNLESGSTLAVLGNFVTGDDIIAKSSADRRLIDILTSTAPVAIGDVKVYDSIPTPGVAIEQSSTLRGALSDGKRDATVDSPVKVADKPEDVTTLIEDVMTRPSAKWFPQRIIYSGSAALGNSGGVLNIPDNTRLIVKRDVTQNKEVKITKQGLINSGVGAAYGFLEIADGASITVTKGLDSTDPTLKLTNNSTSTSFGKLFVASGGTLIVAKEGTLDLSETSSTVILYGEIKVETGGIVALPTGYDNPTAPEIEWGPQNTVEGKITLVANSVAGTDILEVPTGGSTLYPRTPYIGPVEGLKTDDYSWVADDLTSEVTLEGTKLTLNDGKLSVTGANVPIGVGEAVVVEKGTLTVEKTATLKIETGGGGVNKTGTLTVGTEGSVVVDDKGTLDLNTLTVANDKNVVTLNGKIEVKRGGNINLPAFGTELSVDKDTWPQINYAGGGIKLNAGSKAKVGLTIGATDYVGPSEDSFLWEWAPGSLDNTSSVDLLADGEFAVTGVLTSVGASGTDASGNNTIVNTIVNKLTVNSGAVLTVPSTAGTRTTLKLDASGKLDVKGKIVLAPVTAAVGATPATLGGELNLIDVVTASAITLFQGGVIDVKNGAKLTLQAVETTSSGIAAQGPQIRWSGGSVKLNAGSTMLRGTALFVEPFGQNGSTELRWADTDLDTSLELKGAELVLTGKINIASPSFILYDRLILEDKANDETKETILTVPGAVTTGRTLTIADNASITVKGNAKLALNGSGGTTFARIALGSPSGERPAGRLVLEPAAKLSAAGATDTIVGYYSYTPTVAGDVRVTVSNENGGAATRGIYRIWLNALTTNVPSWLTYNTAADTQGSSGIDISIGGFRIASTYASTSNVIAGANATTPNTADPLVAGGGTYITFTGAAAAAVQ
jgi:hypothetical protein